jgi:hypothetical protein
MKRETSARCASRTPTCATSGDEQQPVPQMNPLLSELLFQRRSESFSLDESRQGVLEMRRAFLLPDYGCLVRVDRELT